LGERILEAALNRCLPRHEIFVRATRVEDIFTSVILQDYPLQCRGDVTAEKRPFAACGKLIPNAIVLALRRFDQQIGIYSAEWQRRF
jgi:hypothetical protein